MIMKKNINKTLAIIGTLLVGLPILTPFLFSIIFFLRSGQFHFDYLMPGEVFPAVLIGGGLLLWVALRTRSHIKLIAWGYGLAFFILATGLFLAQLTGLASGKTDPSTSPWMVVVMGGLIGYDLLVLLMGVAGIFILHDLFTVKE